MSRISRRRYRNLIALAVACLLMYVWHTAHGMTLMHPSLVSGWSLTGLMVFLTAYNLRKKLAFPSLSRSSSRVLGFLPLLLLLGLLVLPPLIGMSVPTWTALFVYAFALLGALLVLPIRSSTWLQLHLYAGFLSVFVFALHVGPRIPDGGLELALAALYLAVVCSGLVGIYVTRRFPALISNRGEEVIFERLPAFLTKRRLQAEALVLATTQETGGTAVSDFYLNRLQDYFSGHRNLWLHLRESRRPLQVLQAELKALEPFCSIEEKAALGQLGDLVLSKDELDYDYAHQAALKYWLFLHIPLSYGLLLFSCLHVLLVFAFGGIR